MHSIKRHGLSVSKLWCRSLATQPGRADLRDGYADEAREALKGRGVRVELMQGAVCIFCAMAAGLALQHARLATCLALLSAGGMHACMGASSGTAGCTSLPISAPAATHHSRMGCPGPPSRQLVWLWAVMGQASCIQNLPADPYRPYDCVVVPVLAHRCMLQPMRGAPAPQHHARPAARLNQGHYRPGEPTGRVW